MIQPMPNSGPPTTRPPLSAAAILAEAFLSWLFDPDKAGFWRRVDRHIASLRVPKPRPVGFVPLRQEFDSMSAGFRSFIVGRPKLDAPGDPDVVKRELRFVIGDGEPQILDVTAGVPEIRIPTGSEFTLQLRDTDEAGNASEWSDAVPLVARDTFGPHKAGAVGFDALRQEFEEEPAPPADGGGTDGPAPDTGSPATQDDGTTTGPGSPATPPTGPGSPVGGPGEDASGGDTGTGAGSESPKARAADLPRSGMPPCTSSATWRPYEP
jgi:hypothetical protein